MSNWGIAPGAPYRSLIEATARFNLWHGPIRSAKTTHSLMAWLGFLPDAPREGQLFMVGKTEDTLERNILRPLSEANPGFKYNKGQKQAWYGGREIVLLGANDVKAETRVRGVTGAGFYFDELTLLPHDFVKQCQGRMSPEESKAFATTNPDGPYHWVKAEHIDRAEELGSRRFRHWSWPIEANPFLSRQYIEDIKAEYGEGTLWFRRFIEGQWVAAEGAVYDFWDESVHTIPEWELPGLPDELYLSVDYGTSNATSVGLYARWLDKPIKAARLRGYYHSGRETGRQKTDTEYAKDLDSEFEQEKSSIKAVLVDPSAASLKAELKRHGWRVKDAKNEVIDGIRTQAKMLKGGQYKIVNHPSNTRCIRDYGAYLWDEKAQDRGEDKPLKENDHTKDEERYFLHTIYGRKIGNLDALRGASGIGGSR
jgi:PBSX family phage terminase large subunit